MGHRQKKIPENPKEFTREFTFDDRYVYINGATYIDHGW